MSYAIIIVGLLVVVSGDKDRCLAGVVLVVVGVLLLLRERGLL